jgi:hypoxanthine phosphoribosyltransferase
MKNTRSYEVMEYSYDISSIYKDIKESNKKYDYIIGIQRGGMIPAVHLSNALDIPYDTLVWSHSRNQKDKNHSLLLDKSKSCLLVDDILDEGTTLNEIFGQYGVVDTAVLIYNNINKFKIVPTFFAWEIDRNKIPEWFNFWWETV